jgi:hypothetical protein
MTMLCGKNGLLGFRLSDTFSKTRLMQQMSAKSEESSKNLSKRKKLSH